MSLCLRKRTTINSALVLKGKEGGPNNTLVSVQILKGFEQDLNSLRLMFPF